MAEPVGEEQGRQTEDSAPTTQAARLGKRLRHARRVIAFSIFVMGGCGLVYEYTLGVLGNHLLGSSHQQIFVIIGIMMFAMGAGAALQSRFRSHLVDWFVGLELLLGFIGGTATLLVYTAFIFLPSYQVVLFGVAFLIGLLIGLEIPLAIRLNEEYTRTLSINLSDILGMDYLGALIGALLFAYVLLSKFALTSIGIALGLVNTSVALGVLLYFWPLTVHRRSLAAGCVLSILLLASCLVLHRDWVARLEQRCFADPIIHSETSVYQHLVLTKRGERLQLFLNGKLQFSSSDEHIYHELLVHPAMSVAPRRDRVLILGGGDGLALREVLRYDDVRHVTLVDIDPAVTRLAREHEELVRLNQGALLDARVDVRPASGVEAGPEVDVRAPTHLAQKLIDDTEYELARVRLVHVDADLFVRELGDRYDVLILDFPDPSIVEIAKLFSVGFYRALAERASPEALVAVQASSPWFARRAFLCIGETLRRAGFAVVPYHENVPSFGEWGWYLATPVADDSRTDGTALRRRIESLEEIAVPTRHLTPELLHAATHFGREWLESDEPIEANTRLRPVLFEYYSDWPNA